MKPLLFLEFDVNVVKAVFIHSKIFKSDRNEREERLSHTHKKNHMLECRFEFDADFGNDKRIPFNFK